MADMVAQTPVQRLLRLLVRLAKRLLKAFPKLVYRVLEIAVNPRGHVRQLLLVAAVQICSFLLQRLRNQMRRGILIKNDTARAQDEARTYEEWFSAEMEINARKPVSASTLSDASKEFFEHIHERTENYRRLQREGDEYGLMYHLRSELMRKQTGGAGYSRDGSKWLREHAGARSRIQMYEKSVCSALRYIASGEAPGSSRAGQRLAFINETRHAFGRTALLLSGGASCECCQSRTRAPPLARAWGHPEGRSSPLTCAHSPRSQSV
jgi:TAG lipase/steryl ester hydrolase/phospholipase A2/LPA acyltransferase